MHNADTPTSVKIPNRIFFSPLFLVALIRTLGWRRGLADWSLMVASVPGALLRFAGRDARRRWESEPSEVAAVNLFKIGVPVGLAAILYAIGSGFGL